MHLQGPDIASFVLWRQKIYSLLSLGVLISHAKKSLYQIMEHNQQGHLSNQRALVTGNGGWMQQRNTFGVNSAAYYIYDDY